MIITTIIRGGRCNSRFFPSFPVNPTAEGAAFVEGDDGVTAPAEELTSREFSGDDDRHLANHLLFFSSAALVQSSAKVVYVLNLDENLVGAQSCIGYLCGGPISMPSRFPMETSQTVRGTSLAA